MSWKQSHPELIEPIDQILLADPHAERRKMFGY